MSKSNKRNRRNRRVAQSQTPLGRSVPAEVSQTHSVPPQSVPPQSSEIRVPQKKAVKEKGNKKKVLIRVFITVLLLVVVDFAVRDWEMHSLVSRAEKSEKFINKYKADLLEIQTDKGDGLNFSEVDQSASKLAISTKNDLEKARVEIDSLFVLPWHTAIKDAKTEYALHNVAWIVSIDTTSNTDDGIIQSTTDVSRINETWDQSIRSLKSALTFFDVMNLADRIKKLEVG